MMKKTTLGLLAVLAAATASAGEFEVAQKNKAFSIDKLTIKVGDTVRFPNQDPVHHNVFSLSEAKTFDLGSYGKGKSKSIVFDQPGTIEVECAIHPSMMMTIEVTE